MLKLLVSQVPVLREDVHLCQQHVGLCICGVESENFCDLHFCRINLFQQEVALGLQELRVGDARGIPPEQLQDDDALLYAVRLRGAHVGVWVRGAVVEQDLRHQ